MSDKPAIIINLNVPIDERCFDCEAMKDFAEAAAFAEITIQATVKKYVCREHLHEALRLLGIFNVGESK